MAHHDYLGLEGGEQMVEFIVRKCALSDEDVRDFHLLEFLRKLVLIVDPATANPYI